MKISLAPRYRFWMLALLPATLGVGTAAMWAHSMKWPLRIEPDGLRLRYRRKVPWKAITKISVWRDSYDGRVSRMDIQYGGTTSKVNVRRLDDGERVAKMIVAAFKEARDIDVPAVDITAMARPAAGDHAPGLVPEPLAPESDAQAACSRA